MDDLTTPSDGTTDAAECHAAARGGHAAVLQWLRANGCGWDAGTCFCAAANGHLEVLQWARANGCPWDRAECLDVVPRARSGEGREGSMIVREGGHVADDQNAVREWIQGQAENG